MDVKGAKALSERLAEAARNVDPPPAKAVGSGGTDRGSEVVEHDAPYPGLERAVATEGASLAHRCRKRVLHRVPCSLRVSRHTRGDACEHVEATPVQLFELVADSLPGVRSHLSDAQDAEFL